MKKLLLFTFLVISLKSIAQDKGLQITFDTSRIKIIHQYRLMFANMVDTPFSQLTLDDKGKLEIHGDTVLIIKDILGYFQQQDSIINALKEGIQKAVIVTNQLPENLKKENKTCGWNVYQKFLRKLGYEVVTLKQGHRSPCK